jgi:hypothetical protein
MISNIRGVNMKKILLIIVLIVIFTIGAAGKCCKDADCKEESKPRCKDPGSDTGKCVECLDNNDCSEPEPACELGNNECVECTSNDHCSDTPNTPACDTDTNTCVECTTHQHCSRVVHGPPYCNSDTHECVDCLEDNHCATRYDYKKFCHITTCVQCEEHVDCLVYTDKDWDTCTSLSCT